eukprot:11166893-Lingulodinium_polyedra.AAC.1
MGREAKAPPSHFGSIPRRPVLRFAPCARALFGALAHPARRARHHGGPGQGPRAGKGGRGGGGRRHRRGRRRRR